MAGNKNLHNPKKNKKDEFYTQLTDIQNELRHYKAHFKGKTVYCNCDDPYESNFFKYFALNFNQLGLKKLITTSYAGSLIAQQELPLTDSQKEINNKTPYKTEITQVQDMDGNGSIDLKDIELILKHNKNTCTKLKQGGDFRSAECIELLKQADIVVTNPPFSLFREYVAQLVKYNKKFLIIGNQNSITYKDIFPLIKQEKIWLGFGFNGNAAHFINKHYEDYATASNHKEGMIRVSGVVWLTNLDHKKRHEKLVLYKQYSPEEYPHYDNYDAIEVSKTAEIPKDWDGVMGVPITFLDKYNPEQFEILGMCENEDLYNLKTRVYTSTEKKNAYFAKFGKSGNYDLNASGVILSNGRLEKVYQRVLIRNKQPEK